MAGLFKSIKRVMTGQIIRRSDVPLMNGKCVMSLRIKRDSEAVYVVLASNAAGNHQYYPFDTNEFAKFVEAAIEIRDALPSGIKQKTANLTWHVASQPRNIADTQQHKCVEIRAYR